MEQLLQGCVRRSDERATGAPHCLKGHNHLKNQQISRTKRNDSFLAATQTGRFRPAEWKFSDIYQMKEKKREEM
jgi:hypothetical protein